MTITFEQVAWGLGIVSSLAGWSWWLVAWVARRHAEVTAAIDKTSMKVDAMATATASSQQFQLEQMKHMHEKNELRMEQIKDRVANVEKRIDGITKVVVFGPPKEGTA